MLFREAADELEALLLRPDVPDEARAHAVHLFESPSKVFRIVAEIDRALGAPHARLRPHASDALLEMIAAARAGDWERFIVIDHRLFPSSSASAGRPQPSS